MNHIFISYDRRDSNYIDFLKTRLEKKGFHIWLDREDIRGGDQWRRQIVDAIESASVFVLVLSPNSIQSDNVRKELDIAESSGTQTIPIEIAHISLPSEMKYQLAGLQRIDFKGSFDEGFINLLNSMSSSRTIKPIRNLPKQKSTHVARIKDAADGEALRLTNIMYWPKKSGVFDNTDYEKGTLVLKKDVLIFLGQKKGKLAISNIENIYLARREFGSSKWVKVEYSENQTPKIAFFHEIRKLSWKGLQHGNDKLLELLTDKYLM